MNAEKLKAIAEAPAEVKNDWSDTQQFIANVVEEVREEIDNKNFDGDTKNGIR